MSQQWRFGHQAVDQAFPAVPLWMSSFAELVSEVLGGGRLWLPGRSQSSPSASTTNMPAADVEAAPSRPVAPPMGGESAETEGEDESEESEEEREEQAMWRKHRHQIQWSWRLVEGVTILKPGVAGKVPSECCWTAWLDSTDCARWCAWSWTGHNLLMCSLTMLKRCSRQRGSCELPSSGKPKMIPTYEWSLSL